MAIMLTIHGLEWLGGLNELSLEYCLAHIMSTATIPYNLTSNFTTDPAPNPTQNQFSPKETPGLELGI